MLDIISHDVLHFFPVLLVQLHCEIEKAFEEVDFIFYEHKSVDWKQTSDATKPMVLMKYLSVVL